MNETFQQRRERVRASIWAAVAKYGADGKLAVKMCAELDGSSGPARRIVRAADPGEEMMKWWREVQQVVDEFGSRICARWAEISTPEER